MRGVVLILALAFLLLDLSAVAQTAISPDGAESAESRQYFPAGVFDKDPTLSSHEERAYASSLIEMKETSLFEAAKKDEPDTFRFLLIWMNHALSARLTLNSDGTGRLEEKTLIAKHSGGSQVDKPEIIVKSASMTTSSEQVRQFQALFQKADFWSLTTSDKSHGGLDGFEWIFEASRHHRYHVVARWSPKEGDYTRVCRSLLNLSPMKLDKNTLNGLP